MCDNEAACETTVPTEVVSVPQSRRHLRQWLDLLGWPEPARDDILLAVGEAVTNAVEHSTDKPESTGPDQAVVDISARVELDARGARRVRVRILDHGRWREPGADPTRSRFGIPFMFELMDQVTITRGASGTEVTLVAPTVSSPRTPLPQPGTK